MLNCTNAKCRCIRIDPDEMLPHLNVVSGGAVYLVQQYKDEFSCYIHRSKTSTPNLVREVRMISHITLITLITSLIPITPITLSVWLNNKRAFDCFTYTAIIFTSLKMTFVFTSTAAAPVERPFSE